MDDAIRRSVERQFPELTGGYHLPRFGRVVAVPDAPVAPGLCDDFRPRFGVDVEVLLPDGEPDPDLPILTGLPLPAPMGGQEAGMFGFPGEGTTVVVSFAYGLPHKPFITQILPHGLSLPRVPKGEQVWQHSEACQQRVDADGNWLRQTDGKIQDKAIEREVEAMQNTESFQSHTRTVDDHSSESVGGIKTIEALGALKLLSGGSASLAAVDDLHQATGRDLNLVVGQKHNATVGGDMEERIQGLRESVAAVSQRLVAPKTWLGSEDLNVLQVLCDLLQLVYEMNAQIADHVHGETLPPSRAAEFVQCGLRASKLSMDLRIIRS
ncbi:hypothetical protein PS683_04852 [Pseudomonas fluorescens]|uniref:Gp5/Type VI secretion system Vgr protein OB-fold domain-containing protein n=1 Tax=Pseudomonas fluorescens TaxID=294 RepID=A0A5E6WNF9_PSEFL|nr:hypothetical protein PS683_04852 [Pseudomonas fluorescens]VVN30469.1 hypothetical protein PS683_04852 [Pseudomonas fluorescens]